METPPRHPDCIEFDNTPLRDERGEPQQQSTKQEGLITIEMDAEPSTNTFRSQLTLPPMIQRQREWPSNRPFPTKRGRRVRSPVWFLEMEGACFVCLRFVPARVRSIHLQHVPGPEIYADAVLIRPQHLEVWSRLFNQFIRCVMDYFKIDNLQGVVRLIGERHLTALEPREPVWSRSQTHALDRYFSMYGGLVMPRFITLNPANSVMVLAHPTVAQNLITSDFRRFLTKHCV